MDIVKRMTLLAAKQPRTEAGKLMLEAIDVIESLKQALSTQQHEKNSTTKGHDADRV